jgi:hypothetical protein
MVCPWEGRRQLKLDAKRKRENLYRHVFAKRNAKRLRPRSRIARRLDLRAIQGPPSATPSSIGCNTLVLQRQPSRDLRNANDFSILSLCATRRFSRVRGEDFSPDAWSQHDPVQVVAIGLHTANGARIFIST